MSRTEQEIFNQVVTHLRTQKVPSYEQGAGCRYRGPNGTSCAVGCLMPDSAYDESIEGEGLRSQEVLRRLRALGFTDVNLSLLYSLQGAHDEWADAVKEGLAGDWGPGQEASFTVVAINYRLTMPEVTA